MEWNKVTWYSWVAAVIVFGGAYAAGFYTGNQFGLAHTSAATTELGTSVIDDVTFACDAGKTIRAIFHAHDAQLLLSDGRNLTVSQAVSASGARYANADESFVFWTKGRTASITEASSTTFANCNLVMHPE